MMHRRSFGFVCAATVVVLAGCSFDSSPVPAAGVAQAVQALGPKPDMDVPVLSVVDATETTITIEVCGGPTTGAPAGFSLHWTTSEQFLLTGWDEPICEG